MLAIAREANMPVGKVDCEPNLTVTFTADAGELVRHIHARKPNQLRELSRAKKEQLLNGSAPVRWWYATQMLDRDGMAGNNISPGWIGAGEGSGASPGVSESPPLALAEAMRRPPTNIIAVATSGLRTVRSLYGATVIVDATKAGSTPIDAISAYAAMVAFAEMNASAAPPDSILGLFKPESIEIRL